MPISTINNYQNVPRKLFFRFFAKPKAVSNAQISRETKILRRKRQAHIGTVSHQSSKCVQIDV